MAKSEKGGMAAAVPPDGPGVHTGEPGMTAPAFGTPRPVVVAGDLPRVVNELERAPRDCVRIKVRCNNYTPRKTRYILAARGDAAEAQASNCYLQAEGLDRELARLKKIAGARAAEVEEPDLVLTVLAD